jgi:DNA-binding response OmpR family regulator
MNRIAQKIMIVDDEADSSILRSVRQRLEDEGWITVILQPEPGGLLGEEFEAAAMWEIEEERPDAVLLDVRFGDHRDDRFKGLEILGEIVKRWPRLPVLIFTQYAQGPERETAVRGTLKWDAPVDFIDKLAGTDEVVLRLRRLMGASADRIAIGGGVVLDLNSRMVSVDRESGSRAVNDIQGMKFEILRELAAAWHRSPGELVPFSHLERFSEGEDPRASLRVRIREIKDSLGRALGVRFGPGELIINVRDKGYRLTPPQA